MTKESPIKLDMQKHYNELLFFYDTRNDLLIIETSKDKYYNYKHNIIYEKKKIAFIQK